MILDLKKAANLIEQALIKVGISLCGALIQEIKLCSCGARSCMKKITHRHTHLF